MGNEAGRSVVNWWIGLVVVSWCLVGVDYLGWSRGVRAGVEMGVVPVKRLMWSQAAMIEEKMSWWKFWRDGQEELVRLRGILENQAVMTVEVGELREENDNLRKLMRVQIPGGRKAFPARVMGRQEKSLVIDQGESSGVEVGQMVMSVMGSDETNLGSLVGRVEQVSAKQARVEMITSSTVRIPVVIRDSVTAEVKGEGILVSNNGELVVDKLLPQESINVGNVVSTGGTQESVQQDQLLWLPGIAVGVVTKVRFEKETDIYQQAEVSWLARDEVLKNVFVMIE